MVRKIKRIFIFSTALIIPTISLPYTTINNSLRRDVSSEELTKRKSITDLLLDDWGDNQESDKIVQNHFPVDPQNSLVRLYYLCCHWHR